MRAFIRKTILSDIRTANMRSKNHKLNRAVQTMLFGMVERGMDADVVGDKGKVAANKQFIAQSVEMSKSTKKKLEEEKRVDSTVFEYDEVWDKMQQAKLKQKEAKEAESKERKVSTLPPSCIVPVFCER